MYKSLVLGFVSLTLLADCSAVGAGLGNIESGSAPLPCKLKTARAIFFMGITFSMRIKLIGALYPMM